MGLIDEYGHTVLHAENQIATKPYDSLYALDTFLFPEQRKILFDEIRSYLDLSERITPGGDHYLVTHHHTPQYDFTFSQNLDVSTEPMIYIQDKCVHQEPVEPFLYTYFAYAGRPSGLTSVIKFGFDGKFKDLISIVADVQRRDQRIENTMVLYFDNLLRKIFFELRDA